jgi:putative aminopeptidase FrvX
MTEIKTLLENLSNANGVSGYENEANELMAKELSKVCDVEVDRFGNVIGKSGSGGPVTMLAAHVDEVGLLTRYVDENGFVMFLKMGGIDDRILPTSAVTILSEKREIPGVLGFKPPHLLKEEDEKKVIKSDDMYVDTGLSKEELDKFVQVGDPIAFDTKFKDLGNGVFMGKAFDNRVGCAVMVEAMKRLKDFPGTVYAVSTTQEEIGLKGARTSAFKINPDYALSLDTTIAGDTPDVTKKETTIAMGKGPCITIVESSGRGMVPSPKVKRHLLTTARENNIPYQLDAWKSGMTDAAVIYMTREGIPSGGLCVPVRYLHSPVGLVGMDDIQQTTELVVRSVEGLGDLDKA